MYLLDMNVWKIVSIYNIYIFNTHVSSCLSLCLCEMSMQRTVLLIIFIIFEQQDAFHLGTMVIFKGPVTAKRLVRAHGLEKTRNGALLYFLYAYHACHVSHVYLACLSHTTRLYMACSAMTISVTYLPARAKVCHAMAHDRNCMMQRTSTLWNVMVSTAIEGPGRPALCTFCKYVKKRKNVYV